MTPGETAVLNWYDHMVEEDAPYWSLWMGKQIMGSSRTGDQSDPRTKLVETLQFIYANPQTGKYTIKLHDDPLEKRITDKTDCYASFNFYPATGMQLGGIGSAGMEFPNNPGMQLILNELRAVKSDNEALRAMITDEDDTDDGTVGNVPANPFLDFINKPEVINALIPRVMGFIDTILPAAKPTDNNQDRIGAIGHVPGISPLDQHAKANQALQILAQHDELLGDDLLILASIAETDPEKFKMIIDTLRLNG